VVKVFSSSLGGIHFFLDLYVQTLSILQKDPCHFLFCQIYNSRPCNNCINKMNKIGIRKVYYSTQDGNIVYEFVKEMKLIQKTL
jgi:hypothetical protein